MIKVNKVRSLGLLLDKKHITEEKVDKTGHKLNYSLQQSMRYLAQETGLSKPSTAKVMKMFKL